MPFFPGGQGPSAPPASPPVYMQTGPSVGPPIDDTGAPALNIGAVNPPLVAPAGTPAIAPQTLLEQAVRALEAHGSISAGIRQQVHLFDKQLVGSGSYLELRQPGVPLIRLELRIEMGDDISSLLQVCDGHYLWTYHQLSETEKEKGTLTRIDAVRALRGLEQAGAMPNRDPALLPGLGGLSKLLRALNANFQFTSVQDGKIKQLAVWRLEGGWQPAVLARLLPKQREAILQGKAADVSRLAEHLPDQVVVFLGKEDGFPYRIEYRRNLPKGTDSSEGERSRALVTMELLDPAFNVPIEPTRFLYSPGTADSLDQTAGFLQSLGVGN